MCFWRQRPKYYHAAILVGPAIDGEPVAPFNRIVIWVPLNEQSVETGTFGAVKTGGGKIKNVEQIGRVAVALQEHLWIVQYWVEDALKEASGAIFEDVIKGVGARMSMSSPPLGGETIELDVFSACIENRTKNNVFVYRPPSSFP
jgi:hypothetical protein